MELFGHAADLIGLGRLTVTVSFHEPVTIDRFASRKALSEYCQRQIVRSHSDAISGRLQPAVGPSDRRDWILWRLRHRLRDLRGRRSGETGLPTPRKTRRQGRSATDKAEEGR